MTLNQVYDPAVLRQLTHTGKQARWAERGDVARAVHPTIIRDAVNVLVRAVASYRAAGARRALTHDLLSMPKYLQRDVGIDLQYIQQPIDARFWPTRK